MTGAEHFDLAQNYLSDAHDLYQNEDVNDAALPALLGMANAHATLALAAAVERQNRLAHGTDDGGYGAELMARVAVR